MTIFNLNKGQLLTYGLPFLVILAATAIALSPILARHPNLAWAIIFDLTLTAPLLFLILSRKNKISKIRAVPIFVLGVILASYLIPKEEQQFLHYIKRYVLPIFELIALFYVLNKIKLAIRTFKQQASQTLDFHILSKRSTREVFGNTKLTAFLSSEISMFYYVFSSWRKRSLLQNEYSNYKDNGGITLAAAFLVLVLIETLVFHILLVYFDKNLFAWILTLSSCYSALLIFAHIRALVKRPTVLVNESVHLKNGLIADISIPLKEIKKIELTTTEIKSEQLKVGNLGLHKESTSHNIALYFNNPQKIEKIYGFTAYCDILLFQVDNKMVFAQKIQQAIESLQTADY